MFSERLLGWLRSFRSNGKFFQMTLLSSIIVRDKLISGKFGLRIFRKTMTLPLPRISFLYTVPINSTTAHIAREFSW